ncbi:hypothetical protein GCM10027594_27180 [Hymenobacter agri]
MAQKEELTLEQALARIEEQATRITEQATRITDLEGEVDEATGTISDLQEQLANAQAGAAINETVVVTHTAEDGSKDQYKVLAPKFQHKHQAYAAADLKTNPDLVKELVEGKSGVLLKLEKAARASTKKDASK